MQRRDVLASGATLVTAGLLAGCATDAPADDPADTDDPPSTDTPSPTPTPTVTGTDFTLKGINSGTRVNEATVSFGDDGVTVTGTIAGADGCKTGYLKSAELSDSALVVTVATKDRPDAGMCTTAIVEIDYEATVAVDGPLPSRVTVVHESMDRTVEVATAER